MEAIWCEFLLIDSIIKCQKQIWLSESDFSDESLALNKLVSSMGDKENYKLEKPVSFLSEHQIKLTLNSKKTSYNHQQLHLMTEKFAYREIILTT